MSLENIVSEVLRQGQTEANRIKKESGKQVLKTLSEVEAEIKRLREMAKSNAESESKLVRERLMSSAELEAGKLVLQAKAEILDEVKEEALQRLEGLPIVDRERYLRKLIAKARNVIPEGTVHCRAEDKDIVRANLGAYRLGDDLDVVGGIVVESPDRRRRLDMSFDVLFEESWKENISQVAQSLFRRG
jgi:V/A-type H+-transporting ATPase subunit E